MWRKYCTGCTSYYLFLIVGHILPDGSRRMWSTFFNADYIRIQFSLAAFQIFADKNQSFNCIVLLANCTLPVASQSSFQHFNGSTFQLFNSSTFQRFDFSTFNSLAATVSTHHSTRYSDYIQAYLSSNTPRDYSPRLHPILTEAGLHCHYPHSDRRPLYNH